jgi:hypothetical protein
MTAYVPVVDDMVHDCIMRIHEELAEAGATDEEIAKAVSAFWAEIRGRVLN